MNEVLYAVYMTMELWIFLGILMLALAVEAVVDDRAKRRYNTNINSN
jgi:hypothetical protein